ncbi:hypothetical protein [Nocardia wallacei]|uniref:hypothetical protein n=1 Tax=Nocardia wallacei TaxID=480035 RepID=UPI002455A73B|nr:hypothetical protein [Nocardia wallacei]
MSDDGVDPGLQSIMEDIDRLSSGSNDRGAFKPYQLEECTGLSQFLARHLDDSQLDLTDGTVMLAVLRTVDARARPFPVTRPGPADQTDARRTLAVGILIRLYDDNQQYPAGIKARRSLVDRRLGIGWRGTYLTRPVAFRKLIEGYLRFIEAQLRRHDVRDEIVRAVAAELQSQQHDLPRSEESHSLVPSHPPAEVGSSVPQPLRPLKRSVVLFGSGGLVLLVLVLVIAWALLSDTDNAPSGQGVGSTEISAQDAAALEQRFDGKDPRGKSGGNTKCADPPDSYVVPSSQPPVEGPEGATVGAIQLRASPSRDCPTVVWARVYWNNDPTATYQIPQGWTLHVVSHRPDTNDNHDEQEPASASKIPYGLSAMMSTARGCVFVEVYFTNGDQKTAPAVTTCVKT